MPTDERLRAADVPVRPAATVMLVDDRPDLHVLMVHRTARVVFAPDSWVFPGGRVDPEDHMDDVGLLINGLTDAEASRIVDVAARLGLDVNRHRHQPFERLSGGQKQKLLIAAALGRDSDILILDEPAANLDPAARAIFYELLAERRHQAVMLISSHRLDEVATLVNRVIELDQGRIVLDDRVADGIELDRLLDCRIRLSRVEPAFSNTIGSWGFGSQNGGLDWHGIVAAADRLRFLGTLSRYAGLIVALELYETDAATEQDREDTTHA